VRDGQRTNPMSPRQIVGVDVATACPSKHGLQAVCADQQPGSNPQTLPDGGTSTDGSCNVANDLQPAPSALYILLDDSKDMGPSSARWAHAGLELLARRSGISHDVGRVLALAA